MIELPESVAVVLLDMAEALSGPLSDKEAAFALREARYVMPHLIAAFETAGMDPNEVEFPEIPLMVPGSKAT